MNRSSGVAPALATVALVALLALAGCTGTTCGPGETPIADVPDAVEGTVSIGGTITELSPSRIELDDGTGTALLVSLEGYDVEAAGTGDCVLATGEVIDREDAQAFDVVVRTSSVRLTEA